MVSHISHQLFQPFENKIIPVHDGIIVEIDGFAIICRGNIQKLSKENSSLFSQGLFLV
jgi:hypothetical protein